MLTKEQWAEFNARFREGGRSVCSCGHLGDGEDSQHLGTGIPPFVSGGHGACTVPGCECQRFTWVRWKPEAEAWLKEQEGKSKPGR